MSRNIDIHKKRKELTWEFQTEKKTLVSKVLHKYFSGLTLVLLNCFNCIFRHLKLELQTQFPASNDEKYYYLWKIDMSKIKLLDQL